VRIVPVELGDRVTLKKAHPCGTNDWEVHKLGMDIGLTCTGCGRKVRLLRAEFDRRFRGYLVRDLDATEAGSADAPDTEPSGG